MEKGKKALGVTGFRHPSFVIPDLIGNPEEIRPYVLLDPRVKPEDDTFIKEPEDDKKEKPRMTK